MRILLLAVVAAFVLQIDAKGGFLRNFKTIGGNFARAGANYIDDLENLGNVAGYNFAALGTYWRSNALAGFAQMKRGELEEAMESYNLAISTLAVWDLGQGVAYPIADKLINKIILKYKDDFERTLNAFRDYRNVMKTSVLDDATKVADADVLKGRLTDAKGGISRAFQTDVETGLSRFKNTQIYGDLVTDLRGVKAWAKVAKWADVFAGPLFDAATVAVSAWQLAEAIKKNDPFAIASSSLGLASGLAGLTGFAVAALATAGSTLAAVAGPIGAVIGAVLGIASIIVEIIAAHNPYTQIDADVKMLKQLADKSKELLDTDMQNLGKLLPTQANFEFSWVYGINQGHLIEYVRGRADEYYVPVKFRLDESGRKEGDYMVVGEKKQFDKSKYPDNLFWNPQGIVDLGYDFYGKKVTEEFNGATVIASTELVAGKAEMELKGLDIITYNNREDDYQDSVIIGDMYDIAFQNNIKVKTGAGNDVIVISGMIGKPGHSDYHRGYGSKVNISTTEDHSIAAKRRESNILSFEGMSASHDHDYGITGVDYNLRGGSLFYKVRNRDQPKYFWGGVEGVKMFVGTPFDDTVRFSMDHDYVIRQTKGTNEYIMTTTSWGPFSITIDDQCEHPGKLTIEEGHTFAGLVRKTDLVFAEGTKTMFIYGRQRDQRWQVRGKVFFNRRLDGYPLIRTTADDQEVRLDELPDTFEAQGENEFIDSDVEYNYYFDRSLTSSDCGEFKVLLNPPAFQRGRYTITFHKRKNTIDKMILTENFVSKCLKTARRTLTLIRAAQWNRDKWVVRLQAEDGQDNNECPAKDFEVENSKQPFERLIQRMPGGESRLLVDMQREPRRIININMEMKKMDERGTYSFDESYKGKFGVPQSLELRIPSEQDPATTIKSTINLKGGAPLNEDTLVFTEELRNWLKENNRKLEFEKKREGKWDMRIKKSDGKVTHKASLFNVEWVDYEPADGSIRVPVIPSFGAASEDTIDIEENTVAMLRRNMHYPNYANDCANQ